MNCPYCGEDIDEHTSHCRLCGADLTLIQPLIAHIQHLTQRVVALEKQVAFETEVAEEEAATRPAAEAVLRLPSISDEWAVALGFIGIALAHYAVVVVFDTSLTILLVASIIIPFCAGFLRRGMREHGVLRVIGGALLLAVAALTEMSLLTWVLYGEPFTPQDAHDWHEIYYYGGLIAAGYVIGALIRGLIRFWFVGRGRVRPHRRGLVYRALRAIGEFDTEAVERTEKLMRQAEYTVMNLTALIASIYFLADHLQPALNWLSTLHNAKP
jgi:hypothetical protein